MNSARTGFAWLVTTALLTVVWSPREARAVTCEKSGLFTNQNCPADANCWLNESATTDLGIFYYTESAMASALRACTPSLTDSGLTDEHVRDVIYRAAETWNSQSTGMPLIFDGVVSTSSPETACSSYMFNRPAVFVHFIPGCITDNGSCNGLAAQVKVIPNCDNAIQLVIAGDTNSTTCSGTARLDWELGSQASGFLSLQDAVTHEFGHVLGLADNPSEPSPSTATMMAQANWGNWRHLWYWDKQCAWQYNHGREIRYHWLAKSSTWSTNTSQFSTFFVRGMTSNGFVRNQYGSPYFALYGDVNVRYGPVNTDGVLSFSSTSSTLISDLQGFDVAPVLFAPLEIPYSTHASRMNFLWEWPGVDPPYQRSAYSTGTGIFGSANYIQYRNCNSGDATCNGSQVLAGHVPVTTAWDDYSGTTVYISVDTTRPHSGSGDIYVHAGHHTKGYNYLRTGIKVASTAVPATSGSHAQWAYELRTDVLPGVACANNRSVFSYNCLLAWHDRGVMGGDILYLYFRINSATKAVEFYQENGTPKIWIRGTSDTVTGVAAMYDTYDGFWLTWKTRGKPAKIAKTNNPGPSYASNWSATTYTTPDDYIVDPPSFLYHPTYASESGLLWTEIEP